MPSYTYKQDQWWRDWTSGALHGRLSDQVACICVDGRTWSKEELVTLMRSGADRWNEWHDSLERIRWYRKVGGSKFVSGFLCVLRKADFSRMNLDRFDLTGIEFNACDFSGTSFRRTHIGHPRGSPLLTPPDFIGCRFRRTKFAGIDFGTATFERCDFRGAELNGVRSHSGDFSYSKFADAFISGSFVDSALIATEFAGSNWVTASFIDTDLSVADGLLDVTVHRPVVLDHRTLWRSGPLPPNFYRMCGFPEIFVDYLPSMVQRAINLQSCFISYSSQDDAFVRRIYTDLQKYKVRAFFAPKDLKIGARIREELESAIHAQDKLLLVLSRKSISSQWVEYEVEAAIARENREKRDILFPITIDDEVFKTSKAWAATLRRQRHIGDFRDIRTEGPYQSALRKLLSDLAVDTN